MKISIYACTGQDTIPCVQVQLEMCRDYAKKNGHIIVAEYVDEVRQHNSSPYPAFEEMVNCSGEKQFDAILVYSLVCYTFPLCQLTIRGAPPRLSCAQPIAVHEYPAADPAHVLEECLTETFAKCYQAQLSARIKEGIRKGKAKREAEKERHVPNS